MAITDELRKLAKKFTHWWYDPVKDEYVYTTTAWCPSTDAIRLDERLVAIANRIDAELAEHYVELPKDADGEYIHVGDEMEGVDKYDSPREVTGRVITVSFEADELVDVAVRARNDDGKTWRRAYLDPCASLYRHHHEPTVEDVLREFAQCWDDPMRYDRDELVEQYAAKIKLADDGREQ